MDEKAYGFFDLAEIKSRFPDHADSMIVDAYLSDHESASARLFRLYHPIPRHLHKSCDEHLILLDGEVDFTIADEPPRRLRAGQMVTFLRNIVHGIQPADGAGPVVFFTVDTPRREPNDVHFVDPTEVRGRRFVTHLANFETRLT
jgi:mannose-6-phosphate isomerase-like protein (cupin superfamily)